MRAVFPVSAGLAAGIALLLVTSMMFPPGHGYNPRPGIHAEEAAKIVAEDSTMQTLLGDREVMIRTARDVGVWGSGCPQNWCAIVLVSDKSDPRTSLYSALVNVRDREVASIHISQNLLISQVNENVDEVSSFISRYPDAETEVKVGSDRKSIIYTAYKTYIGQDVQDPGTKTLSVVVETTSLGRVISVYAQCDNEKVTSNVAEFVRTTDCLEP
jgi:hypothetical protein